MIDLTAKGCVETGGETLSVTAWLQREVCGRHSAQQVETAVAALAAEGVFSWPGSSQRCRVVDHDAFVLQLAAVRRVDPGLLAVEPPDHFLGEY